MASEPMLSESPAEPAAAPEAPASAPARREHPRYTLEIAVDLQSEHNFYTGLTQNISAGGLYVATNALRPIGAAVRVKLTLPGSSKPVEVDTEVRWVKELSSLRRFDAQGMGLRFVDLSDEAVGTIKAFLAKRDSLFYDDE